MAIIRDILKGIDGASARAEVLTEPDRRKAIALAVSMAAPGDMVLICGKGHENYQIVDGVKYHFDDSEEAGKAMAGIADSGKFDKPERRQHA